MLHTYPFGHSHAFRSEALKCKNEPYQGRTYGTTWVDSYLLLLRSSSDSRHVLSGGQNVHACRARRTMKSQSRLAQRGGVVTITRAQAYEQSSRQRVT